MTMKKVYRAIRRLSIAILGFVVFIIGLILIPLPGPGVLVCIVGLTILSWEFEWAMRHKKMTMNYLIKILEKSLAKLKSSKN